MNPIDHQELIETTRNALGQHGGAIDGARLHEILGGLQPEDIAVLLDALTIPEAERVFGALPDDRASDVLFQIAPTTKRQLLHTASPARVAGLLQKLPPDEAAEVVVDSGYDGERALAFMTPESAGEVRALLAFPEHSAGRLMTTRFVAVPENVTAAWTLAHLRHVGSNVETLTVIYVIDRGARLVGVCGIRDVLLASPAAIVGDFATRDVITVSPEADQQEVARVIGRYDLVAVPVVDRDMHMLGIVTVDDIVDVLTEEFSEDYAGLVGTDAAEMQRRTPTQVARLRLPWLIGTMAIELGAGLVIARFNQVLERAILLASFMPVISAVSGNVGLQAAAIAVRGLDTGHVALHNWADAVRREVATAFTIAAVVGTLLGVIAVVWSRHLLFGAVVAVAMTCAVVTAAFMGTVIPLLSKQAGFDPATTAGPFETALQDVVGFTVFLALASWLVNWLQ